MFLGLLAEAEKGSAHLLMSAIKVGEVFYFLRKNGAGDAHHGLDAFTGGYLEGGVLKADHRIAYADAFAAALAQKYRCPRLTGDPEFRAVANLELDWIGR